MMEHPNEILSDVMLAISEKDPDLEKIRSLLKQVQVQMMPGVVRNWTLEQMAQFYYYAVQLHEFDTCFPSFGIFEFMPPKEVLEIVRPIPIRNRSSKARYWYRLASGDTKVNDLIDWEGDN